MSYLSALIANLKTVRSKFGLRASSYSLPTNFVNDSCLFLSLTFVLVLCFLAGITVVRDHFW